MSNQVANALVEMGIGHGDKVALNCPNLPFFPIVYYGIMKAGAAVVPICVLFKPREIAYHLHDSDAKAVFVFEGTDELPMGKSTKEAFDEVETCEHLIVMTKDPWRDVAVSTDHKTLTQIIAEPIGRLSKSIRRARRHVRDPLHLGHDRPAEGCRTHASQLWSNVVTTYGIHLPMLDFTDGEQKTVSDHAAAVSHDRPDRADEHAISTPATASFCCRRFEPKATLETMVKEKVNFWVGVPTMYWALLKYVEETGYDISRVSENMKVCTSGGAPMPVEVMKEFRGEVRRPRARGLRPVGNIAARLHSTISKSRRSRERSARRSSASRSDALTKTTTKCRAASAARSSSAART